MKVYKSEKAQMKIWETYDQLLSQWGVELEQLDLETTYGISHVITCGEKNNPPLILLHGVGDDSALMWIYNAGELSKHFRIYAVDTIGGPGKSRPNAHYGKEFDELKWLDETFDKLRLEKFFVAGVSNGSHMTLKYGIMRPDRVLKMVCMSGAPTAQGDGSPLKAMLKVFLPEALLPTRRNITRLIQKLARENSRVFTDNALIMEHYRWLLKGFNNMSMASHKIQYFTPEQLNAVSGKVLFLCGASDPLGNMEKVKARMDSYHMSYRFFPGVGHGINHEISDEINKIIIEYLNTASVNTPKAEIGRS